MIPVNVLGGCTLLGKGKRINEAITRVMTNNPNIWFTTKELGWVMNETYGVSAPGKSLCRRVMGFDDGCDELHGGRIEREEMCKMERLRQSGKYKYRWVPPT